MTQTMKKKKRKKRVQHKKMTKIKKRPRTLTLKTSMLYLINKMKTKINRRKTKRKIYFI
jgi:hypothetical protein